MIGRVLGLGAVWARDYVTAGLGQVGALLGRSEPVDLPARTGVTVVVVPGVWEPWRYLELLGRRLHARGLGVRWVPALGYNVAPFAEAAAIVHAAIEDLEGDVVLVAHSKGGLTAKRVLVERQARALAGDPPSGPRVAGLVSIATPFGGSSRARLLPLMRSIAELRVGSPALLALAAETAANARIVELVPSWDPHIPDHEPLPGSEVVRLAASGHFHSVDARETLDAVDAAIRRLVARDEPAATG